MSSGNKLLPLCIEMNVEQMQIWYINITVNFRYHNYITINTEPSDNSNENGPLFVNTYLSWTASLQSVNCPIYMTIGNMKMVQCSCNELARGTMFEQRCICLLKMNISAQLLKMALHKNVGVKAGHMVIFLHEKVILLHGSKIKHFFCTVK